MDTKTLQIFALALISNDLPIDGIVEDAASWQTDGVNIWLFRLKGMSGPTFANTPTDSTSYYHWYHAGGIETVFGAFATGTILPCCSDGLQLPPMIPLPGFFAGYVEKIRRIRKSNCCKIAGICIPMERMRMVFIFLEPFLIKLPRASSWLEQFTCFKAGLVKSKSTDKRWCIRADCGKIQFACLTCKHAT